MDATGSMEAGCQPARGRSGPGSAAGSHPGRLDHHRPGGGALAGHLAHRPGRALAGDGRPGRSRDLLAWFVFSVLGPTPEGSSSLVGVGLFIVWMLALSAALWRTPQPAPPRPIVRFGAAAGRTTDRARRDEQGGGSCTRGQERA